MSTHYLLRLGALALLAGTVGAARPAGGSWFSGRIVYRNTIVRLVPAGQHPAPGPSYPDFYEAYYIGGDGYKRYTLHPLPAAQARRYLADRAWPAGLGPTAATPTVLYAARTNELYAFGADGESQRLEAAEATSGVVVTPLPGTAAVAGYACASVQLANAAQATSIVYYYCPQLRVDARQFRQNADYYTLLQATGGAVPLRSVSTNTRQGTVHTREATSVTPLPLTTTDFEVGTPAR